VATVEVPTPPAQAPADEAALITARRAREAATIPLRDRVVSLASAGVVAFAAIVLAVSTHGSPASAWWIVLFAATYAVASRVDFEVGSGLALPTELVLVPMFFVIRPGLVPLVVAAALLLARGGKIVRGQIALARVPIIVMTAAHALGPAIVLTAAHTTRPEWGRWPIYVAALGAQFLFDFLVTAPWTYVVARVRPTAHLREMSWSFLVDASVAPVGLVLAFATADQPAVVLLALPVVGLMGFFAKERRTRIDHAMELSTAYRGTALLLGDVIEADDAYTGSHSRDVVELTLAVADRLHLDPAQRRDAEFAALLHDVGKVKIPAEIINKPGALDAAERAIINMHTIEGERMLEQIGGMLGRVGGIVRSCHERWDGGGYPDGLAGEEIPLVARIVCCCDAYSAMTTDRPYRRALPLAAVVAELRACSGTQFDPKVVDALLAIA